MANRVYNEENRQYVIGGAVVLLVLIFIARLFYLQVLDNDYKAWADSNAFLKKTLYPSRGMLYDRNGKLLVYNQPAYDVMLIMREIQPFDTTDLCDILGITKAQFIKRMGDIKNRKLNPGYSSYVPQVFMNQLSAQEYGVLQEKLYKFPGFYIQNRTIRQYQYPYAAHVLGNIGEVNQRDIQKDPYYVQGDYSGRTGVEKFYEEILRGEKGVEILLRDAHGRIKGRYEEGKHDVVPQSGKNLTLAIDMDLQAYGEKLMQNKLGGIVVIEPETGEILAMVSAPTFDPSMLVGRMRGKNHQLLEKDPNKPLFDRPIMAYYPPGSTFKPVQGLVFLQEGIISPQTMYTCYHGYPLRGVSPLVTVTLRLLTWCLPWLPHATPIFAGGCTICWTAASVIPAFRRLSRFGRTTWFPWDTGISWVSIYRERSGGTFPIVRFTTRFTASAGTPARLYLQPSVRVKLPLLRCRLPIWQLPSPTGGISIRPTW